MVEHKVCKGCQWNSYPICMGTKMELGNFMDITQLKSSFKCGQKDMDILTDFTIEVKPNLEDKVKELEKKVKELEKNDKSKR